MKKPILITLALLVLALGGYFLFKDKGTAMAPAKNENTNAAAVDFIRTGTIVYDNPGLKQDVPYFVFEEPGAPALSKELILDEQSVCVEAGLSNTCMDMVADAGNSVLHGKRGTIEGITHDDGTMLVKKFTIEE